LRDNPKNLDQPPPPTIAMRRPTPGSAGETGLIHPATDNATDARPKAGKPHGAPDCRPQR
jgi:hypothetical protein